MLPDQVTFPLAFGAGVISFLSPCVLPLIPAYITYLTGNALEEGSAPSSDVAAHRRRSMVLNGLLFVAGFSMVFIALGMSASIIGQLLMDHLHLLRRLGGVVVIVFGLYMMGVLQLFILSQERRIRPPSRGPGPLNSLLLGATFSAGWTPCIGPVLGAVLVVAGTGTTAGQGGALLLTYALGLAVPFMALTLSLQRMQPLLRRFMPYAARIRAVSGGLLVVLGVMLYTNTFVLLNAYFNWGF